jgi:hypothetical protein
LPAPDPLIVQLSEAVDSVGYHLGYPFYKNPLGYPRLFTALDVPLTTWLRYPSWAVDSYRRHIEALREHAADLR